MKKKEKLCLLLIFLCLFGFSGYTAEGEEPRFYTIISGDIGGGLGNFFGDSDSDDIYDSNWNDTVYGFAGSIRFCLLSSSFMQKDEKKQSRLLSGHGIRGLGIEINGRRLTQKAGGQSILLGPSYEFRSTSLTATLGFQIADIEDPGPRLALFIGSLGLGYTRNQFTGSLWYFWAKALEEEGIDVDIETEIYPVVFTILPVKLEWLFHKNMAIGLDFSGLLCYRGRTDLTFGDTSDNAALIESVVLSESFWLTNFQIGLVLSMYLY